MHYVKENTGQLRYVKLAYLENTTYVEVMFHSQKFQPIYQISTLFMLNSLITKPRLYRDFHSRKKVFPLVLPSLVSNSKLVFRK